MEVCNCERSYSNYKIVETTAKYSVSNCKPNNCVNIVAATIADFFQCVWIDPNRIFNQNQSEWIQGRKYFGARSTTIESRILGVLKFASEARDENGSAKRANFLKIKYFEEAFRIVKISYMTISIYKCTSKVQLLFK